MPKVIVNSTPMIILSKIGQIDILQQLYGNVIIPQAVYEEVTRKSDAASQILAEKGWIRVEHVRNDADRGMYRSKLHDGEVEVMMLARESVGPVLVIIDDNAAKKTAKYLGLHVTGTLGVLALAKKKGILGSVKPAVTRMKEQGFFISSAVETMVCKACGEE